jgi:DNA (cytosine-5)-methyltransferase 1
VRALQDSGERRVGAVFRRMRLDRGVSVQRAEARFDGLAGCLRTPGGGSSRQFLLFIEGASLRARQLTAREGARLMGLPDSYRLPEGPTAAFHVIGDGVAPPVVRHLAAHLLEPLLRHDALAAAQ